VFFASTALHWYPDVGNSYVAQGAQAIIEGPGFDRDIELFKLVLKTIFENHTGMWHERLLVQSPPIGVLQAPDWSYQNPAF
jgi:hypothetical protein